MNEPLTQIARQLGEHLPVLGGTDARRLLERVVGLLRDGETPGSLLARLNGPAKRPNPHALMELEEPAPDRATRAIVRAKERDQ